MLTESKVVEIYKHKLSLLAKKCTAAATSTKMSSSMSLRGESSSIAATYGVSSRAIRDIWNRQTWAVTTRHLWLQESEIAVTVDFSDASVDFSDASIVKVMRPVFMIPDSEFCCGSSDSGQTCLDFPGERRHPSASRSSQRISWYATPDKEDETSRLRDSY